MSEVKRVYVEKKPQYSAEGQKYFRSITGHLKITSLTSLRVLNRYDVSGVDEEEFETICRTVFAEANTDFMYREELETGDDEIVFAVEYLPGQYDQRADSAAQCVQIMTKKEKPVIKNARVFILRGEIDAAQLERIKRYIINPVDSREASLEKPQSLTAHVEKVRKVRIIDGFTAASAEGLAAVMAEYGLAMSLEDILLIQDYFKAERREPTVTEIKLLDTYWSDHCRHTTFHTEITDVVFAGGMLNERIAKAQNYYMALREELYHLKQKPACLMDLATIYAKKAKKDGLLDDLEESDEINACSIRTKAVVAGRQEDWLVMFKNETHNHPTEIEPFGGAATCLGGAIRDPLSGRSYVYQAMRVTGSGDCTEPVEKTWQGKLPQVKITTEAAAGFSSYGNQIGLATGQVKEYYHEGFKAKRMEVGAVVAAAPAKNVKRLKPQAGDKIILLGGRTGRDGIGGATGSSKAHTDQSVTESGSEVQKGNAPEERKLQRLFRNPTAASMIKKCNDFGAGGVSVAIGELADSLDIYLDVIPKKYEGLDGTELAISESQERMAVLLDMGDVEAFMALAAEENIEATVVADVTESGRLKMYYGGDTIVDLSRAFLDTTGAARRQDIVIKEQKSTYFDRMAVPSEIEDVIDTLLTDLNTASAKGLTEAFDGSIGAGSILMPFGGAYQSTPVDGMAAKLPVTGGDTDTATMMAHGYNPYMAQQSLFHGGIYSVVSALSKLCALGADYKKARLSMQEYFGKLYDDKEKWAQPYTALLGVLKAQAEMKTPAIGGKDSMSGTYEGVDVPPSVICFAVAVGEAACALSPEIKKTDSILALLKMKRDEMGLPDFASVRHLFDTVFALNRQGKIISAASINAQLPLAKLLQMSFGNRIGLKVTASRDVLLMPSDGDILVEVDAQTLEMLRQEGIEAVMLAQTTAEAAVEIEGKRFAIAALVDKWEQKLCEVFPIRAQREEEVFPQICYKTDKVIGCNIKTVRPTVFIPAFPGTNCEIDTAAAFENAGAKADVFIFRNLTTEDILYSVEEMAARIRRSDIIALPGGFSAGDEPDGSGKFIVSVFKNSAIKDAVENLMDVRGGLMLGICNGFQALIKLGLVPYGRILDIDEKAPTLTFNTIGRHISSVPMVRVTSDLSPWLKGADMSQIYRTAVSHGEGRFVADEETLKQLEKNGQIALQYVDHQGVAVSDAAYNINGSAWAIEGITSPDGRILGKMGHSERIGKHLYKNIPGEFDMALFASAVAFFR